MSEENVDWDGFEKFIYQEYVASKTEFILYTEDEYDFFITTAIVSYLNERPEDATEEEIEDFVLRFVRWMEQTQVNYDLAQLVLKGVTRPVSREQREVTDFSFSLTDEGRAISEELEDRNNE